MVKSTSLGADLRDTVAEQARKLERLDREYEKQVAQLEDAIAALPLNRLKMVLKPWAKPRNQWEREFATLGVLGWEGEAVGPRPVLCGDQYPAFASELCNWIAAIARATSQEDAEDIPAEEERTRPYEFRALYKNTSKRSKWVPYQLAKKSGASAPALRKQRKQIEQEVERYNTEFDVRHAPEKKRRGRPLNVIQRAVREMLMRLLVDLGFNAAKAAMHTAALLITHAAIQIDKRSEVDKLVRSLRVRHSREDLRRGKKPRKQKTRKSRGLLGLMGR